MTTVTDSIDLHNRAALSDLATRYAMAVDARTFEQLRGVFVDDAALDTGRSLRSGIEEILAAMEGLRRYTATSHVLGQQHLEARDDGITGVTYCTAHHLSDTEQGRTDTVMHIRYHDHFTRTDAGWRIARRRLEVLWTDTQPVS